MARFNVVKKGYDITEVDDYINNITYKEKESISDKSLRINELLEQVNRLKGELEEYKLREEKVNNALVQAVEKANDIEKFAKAQAKAELERMKLYRDKWIRYCDNVKAETGVKERKSEVVSVLKHLENEFRKSFDEGIKLKSKADINEVEQQYQDEVNRLMQGKKIDEASPFARNMSGKSLDDSLKEDIEVEKLLDTPEFEELCKKLGIV